MFLGEFSVSFFKFSIFLVSLHVFSFNFLVLGLDYIKFSEEIRTCLGLWLMKVLRRLQLLNWVSDNLPDLWIVGLLLLRTLDHLDLGDQGVVLGSVWRMVMYRVIDMLGTVLSRLI